MFCTAKLPRSRLAEDGLAKAETLFRRALAAYVADKGEHHPDTKLTRYSLAGLLLDQDKAAEALPLLESVLPAYERAYGPKHTMVRDVLQRLQNAYDDLGRDAEAEALQPRIDAFDEDGTEASEQ